MSKLRINYFGQRCAQQNHGMKFLKSMHEYHEWLNQNSTKRNGIKEPAKGVFCRSNNCQHVGNRGPCKLADTTAQNDNQKNQQQKTIDGYVCTECVSNDGRGICVDCFDNYERSVEKEMKQLQDEMIQSDKKINETQKQKKNEIDNYNNARKQLITIASSGGMQQNNMGNNQQYNNNNNNQYGGGQGGGNYNQQNMGGGNNGGNQGNNQGNYNPIRKTGQQGNNMNNNNNNMNRQGQGQNSQRQQRSPQQQNNNNR